MTNEQRAEMLK